MKRYIFLFMIMLLSVFTGCEMRQKPVETPQRTVVREKQPAPDLELTALDGTKTRLSALKGYVVMLNFWATWCPPCREEIPSMMRLEKSMQGKPFRMLAVSIDDGGKQTVLSFFKSTGYSLPAYIDQGGKSAMQYGVGGVPETFIIDRKGVIAKRVIGPLQWDTAEVKSYLADLMK